MKAKHIGIVACSVEGAALCYRTICLEALSLMGEHNHPRITLDSIPMVQHIISINRDDWKGVADLMLDSAKTVAQAGAEFAICPDNTCHQAFEFLLPLSPIPWLNIAEVVGKEASLKGFRKLGILGTRYLMEGPVYPDALKSFGIDCEIPPKKDREQINQIIFKELVNAIFTEESRLYFNEVMSKLAEQGCDAAVLGCTEIPLIVIPVDAPLPTLDSTCLLAKAALNKALEDL